MVSSVSSALLKYASYFAIAAALIGVAVLACSSQAGFSEPALQVASPDQQRLAATETPAPHFSRDDISFAEAFGGAAWERPIDIAFLPDGESALIAEQVGDIYLAPIDGSREPELFMSISERVRRSSNEEGLLSIALDPKFSDNQRLWLYYSPLKGLRHSTLSWVSIAEYQEDWSREHIVFELIQPFPNHNGGKIVFDRAGRLYLGLGDGGSAADPKGNGQDLSNHYGTIIRIDISNSSDEAPYTVPSDNPFLGPEHQEVPDEIWAYGLRNPWRMSMDYETGQLWIGDVGQSYREEVNVADTAGGGYNFGWSRMEATQCFKPRKGCDQSGITMPLYEYPPRGDNCTIIGGNVYRGTEIPQLKGQYLFADHCRGALIAIDAVKPRLDPVILGDIAPPGEKYPEPSIVSFGADLKGEIYILRFDGPILKLIPAPKRR